MKKLWTALIIAVFSLTTAQSASAEYLSRTISLDEGISHANVTSLARDSRGFLWIGTPFGLNRYDFEHVTAYFHDEDEGGSLPDNNIISLYADPHGTLWVATEHALCRYSTENDSFENIKYHDRTISVLSFCEEDENLLMGSAGAIYILDRRHDTLEKIQSKGGSTFFYTAIHRWSPGFYILATRWDGLWLFDREKATITRLPGFEEKNITASCVDSRGLLWVSDYAKGVFSYNRSGQRSQPITTENSIIGSDVILDIKEIGGMLWFATDGHGISIYDPVAGEFDKTEMNTPFSRNSSVNCIYTDSHSNIYTGTVREGAQALIPVAINTLETAGGKPFNAITGVAATPGNTDELWIADDGRGIARYNPAENKATFAPATHGHKVTDLAFIDNERILLASYIKGIYIYDTRTRTLNNAPKTVDEQLAKGANKAIAVHLRRVSDDLVLLFSDIVVAYNPKNGQAHILDYIPEENGGPIQPFYNTDGRLLCFNRHTVYEYNFFSSTMERLATMPQNTIYCADFDGESTVYAGTDTGLVKINIATGETSEIPSNITGRITSIILERSDMMWIATTRSLYRRKTNPDGSHSIIGFGRSDGVKPNEYMTNATMHVGRTILFGGVNGLMHINSEEVDRLISNHSDPVFSLADITIDDKSSFGLIDDGVIEIDHGHNRYTLSIIDNGSNSIQRKLFRFIIRNGDNERIVETFARNVSLPFLAEGSDYDICVASSRPDGTWSPEQHLVTMSMLAPWWKSPLAIIIIIAIVCGGTVEWYRRRARKQHARMNEKIDSYRKHVLEQEVAFLVNTNYAMRTPLTLIYAPVKLLLERVRRGEKVDIECELDAIYRNTKRMRDTIDMALELHNVSSAPDDTHLTTHDISRSIQDVIDEHSGEIGDKGIKITYLPAEEMFPAVYDRQRIATVIDTLLNNAIQRSAEGSPIIIKAASNNGFIRVSIIDEGEKLDDETLRQLFSKYFNDDNSKFGNSLGFAFAKNIVELQRGRIGVNNNETAGVTVWFEIPEADTPLAEAYTRRRRRSESTLPTAPLETETLVDDIDTTALTAIVVEEDIDLCMFVARQLQPFFNKVLHAFNGKDALILIKQNLPDIVISSVLLPIKSGLEVCRDIKSSPETSHIPVVLLTAIKEGATLETAYSVGADSYLSKPFDIQILLTRCRNLLHSRAVTRRRYAASAAPATATATLANADESFIMKIDKIISDNISETDFGVNEIVDAMALSRSALYARFKALTNTTLGQYIADKRLAMAKDMLANSSLSISEIAERLGFNSQRYFSTFFKERQNMAPSAFRAEARRQAPLLK